MSTDNDVRTVVNAAKPLIELAVNEDLGPGDATSEAMHSRDDYVVACLLAKENGIIAGLPVAEAVFRRVDASVQFLVMVQDGEDVTPGTVVAEVRGPARSLLSAERIALNFLQRLSGIATETSRYVDAVSHTKCVILDTRKTLPGFRLLDKYAVRTGGGQNHRMGLYDMILIKDNHVDSSGGVAGAVGAARAKFPHLPIEVEVRDFKELEEALAQDPPLDRVLLDNMSPEQMRDAVKLTGGRVPLEASGGVTLESVARIADSGVDYISIGALTHSVEALDISMDVYSPAAGVPALTPADRVRQAKASLGQDLVILAHHYQRDGIVALADHRGDSLELSRIAARSDAKTIVFCGVHFMAETAAVLAKPGQQVISPDPTAGCFLADSATPEGVDEAWNYLDSALDQMDEQITPLTYVNSSAALKAFCGKKGGTVCTSGNAERALAWALGQRPRAFFFPDQHLGRNVAHKLGIANEEIVVWNRSRPPAPEAVKSSRVVLWPGACNVHQRFRPEHVTAVRDRYPDIRVLVHPECRHEVVALADDAGSTAYIIQQVQAAERGSQWAIGTETRLVQRLQCDFPDQLILSLASVPPYCRTMSQITIEDLANVMDELAVGQVVNEVTVEPEVARWAAVALERMLSLP